jgi:zinc protease
MRTDDEPHSLLGEKLMAAAFEEHPYRRPVIGWMSDLQLLTAKDVRNWYREWYAPNNATLIIAGDVKAAEVFKLAQRYYGPIPAKKLPERKVYGEPAQLGVKRITVKAPAELPYLIMAYHAPRLADAEHDWKPYALEVLAGILDGNDSARLNKSLVRETQLAANADAGYDSTSRGPAMFTLEGTPNTGKTVAELEAGIRAQIALLVKDGVTGDELKRVKAQVMAGEVYKLDSLFYQAMQIGQMESIGLGYQDIPVMLKKIQAVTARQVQDVARELLTDDNLSVAVLDPQPVSGQHKHRMEGATHDLR